MSVAMRRATAPYSSSSRHVLCLSESVDLARTTPLRPQRLAPSKRTITTHSSQLPQVCGIASKKNLREIVEHRFVVTLVLGTRIGIVAS